MKQDKKTAIRLPLNLWDDVVSLAEENNISANSYMVQAVSQRVKNDKKANELTSAENLGIMLSNMGLEETLKEALLKGSR